MKTFFSVVDYFMCYLFGATFGYIIKYKGGYSELNSDLVIILSTILLGSMFSILLYSYKLIPQEDG